jgi:hypothetical protein
VYSLAYGLREANEYREEGLMLAVDKFAWMAAVLPTSMATNAINGELPCREKVETGLEGCCSARFHRWLRL